MAKLYWRDVGLAMGSFLVVTYLFCVGYHLVFYHEAYGGWLKLLPGFTWLTWQSFLLGLLEAFFLGFYFGMVFVPLYNFFHHRSAAAAK